MVLKDIVYSIQDAVLLANCKQWYGKITLNLINVHTHDVRIASVAGSIICFTCVKQVPHPLGKQVLVYWYCTSPSPTAKSARKNVHVE